ncbi:Rap1a/Tai family immunity protein [Orrella daihaiensis]|uniref:Rap1a immunity protein domain-containing protein n=1 Tax=Orrella daihaiensis TaxID=2782176 RepID=A0ABY4AHW0_9BURK|nr:Rap1a/Tai family immunity protein [Orrella daihaiensis]UOD49877.1 hypothetical protein DHf2319_10545 [Orrella daihaiensis]
MYKKLTISLAASMAAFLVWPVAKAEQAITTAEMLQYCDGAGGSFVTCEIYGQAVYDTYLVMSSSGQALKTICVKQPAPSRTEVITEYVKWAQGNAKVQNEPAAQSMLTFLTQRFPCQPSR